MRWFKRKSLPVPGSSTFFVNGITSNTSRSLKTFADEGYSQNPIVYTCIAKIAEAAATVKLEVDNVTDAGDKTVNTKHGILDLLAQPNPTQSWKDFIIEMCGWNGIAGEVFIIRFPEKGTPQELYCLSPDAMGVEKNPNGSAVPLAYTYGEGPNKRRYPVNQLDGTSQVLHIKSFNPLDSFRGLPPLKAAARAADTHNNGASWNSNLLLNGARPSGIITMDGAPSETVLGQIKKYVKNVWQGGKNAGDIALLTGGAKFEALSHNPKDMDFKESMQEAAKNIALVFGVPLPLITLEAATHSNMEQAEEALWINTVLPLLDRMIGSLSKFLMPLYGKKSKEVLSYNADSVPALENRREKLFNRMVKGVAGGIVTPDEARAEMGFEAKKGNADLLLIPGTMGLLDKLGQEPAPIEPTIPIDPKAALKSVGFSAEEIKKIMEPA